MNSKKMITHLKVLKKESNESLGFNMQKYHDLYDTDREQAKLHYSIAMDEITKIGVYGSLIQDIQNHDASKKNLTQFSKDYNTFQTYMNRLDNNETLTDYEMSDFTYLAGKCGWRTIDTIV